MEECVYYFVIMFMESRRNAGPQTPSVTLSLAVSGSGSGSGSGGSKGSAKGAGVSSRSVLMTVSRVVPAVLGLLSYLCGYAKIGSIGK